MTTAVIDQVSFEYVRKLLLEKSAIVLEPIKSYLIEARLTPVAKKNGFDSLVSLIDALRSGVNRSLQQQVIDAMTTNETSFFRDVHPFDALRQKLLPQLVSKRASERRLVIWSNACSSGQEVYSIAMIIREHFPELLNWKLQLIATDLSTQILEKARSGLFNQTEVNRGLPLPLLLKNFSKDGLNWRIRDEIRNMVDFRILNLIEPYNNLPPVDIVFLRNVLIYFDPVAKTSILNKVQRVMRPDGYLFLGGAETTIGLNTTFNRVAVDKAVCYQP